MIPPSKVRLDKLLPHTLLILCSLPTVPYNLVCTALACEKRLGVLNTRIDYAQKLQSTLLELTSIKTSHRLEWIIIILIAIE